MRRPWLFMAEDVMDEATCRCVQAAMDAGTPEAAEVIEAEFVRVEEVRRASHVEVAAETLDLVERFLDSQRDPIAAFFHNPIRRREGANLLRYQPGGFYRRHADRGELPTWPQAAQRLITIILFLESSCDVDPNGGFSGGALRLYDECDSSIDLLARRGTLVAFPASMVHEVTPVISGRRDTVVDWFS